MAKRPVDIDTLRHKDKRTNIPTAELQSVMESEEKSPLRIAYERRNRDLDPQLVWRGKDEQDWSDLVVSAPPLYIQEKVHPKVLIDDLMRESAARGNGEADAAPDLFADFNGVPKEAQSAEFYRHDANWTNRMILGDSLAVMASLAEREALKGKVQCIYLDPPYGIKFNSNFQWSTTSRDVKDGKADHITREPEMVKAFRDTWRDGIHSYLTYLRDRLTVARDLLSESGSIFVQIGDDNVHRVRALMDEVFGDSNLVSDLIFQTTTSASSQYIDSIGDHVLWYAKNSTSAKYRPLMFDKMDLASSSQLYRHVRLDDGSIFRNAVNEEHDKGYNPRIFRISEVTSQTTATTTNYTATFRGSSYQTGRRQWSTPLTGMERLKKADRIIISGKSIAYMRMLDDYAAVPVRNIWTDTGTGSFTDPKVYVVQTNTKVVQRCILMATDPGDLVLDPTCGSGTTAYVAEQWGRRWITIDTSRVALALARARIMGARYPWYLLADSPEGLRKEGEITRTPPKERETRGDIRHGFVYERVPHITLKSIANNAEIDVIWERFQEKLEPLRHELNAALGRTGERKSAAEAGDNGPWEEWEIPRDLDAWHQSAEGGKRDRAPAGQAASAEAQTKSAAVSDKARQAHSAWWENRIARQKEIDASIAAKADHEYLYDKPYADNTKVRVAGPFTVESLSPHRVLAVDEDDALVDGSPSGMAEPGSGYVHEGAEPERDFAAVILENLKAAGVQQADRSGRITFTSLKGWPGNYICAEGTYEEGDVTSAEGGKRDRAPAGQAAPAEAPSETAAVSAKTKRAGILIGPEFGTVSRPDLVAAAREAGDAGFDVLIACAFNYDAHSAEFDKLGRIPVLKARMNADLHMAGDLKTTDKGNLFVIFGEPDIDIEDAGEGRIRVRINGVDVFKPQTGEIESSSPDDIACWFIDTDYNEESFFVRHAYFLGASDPYKALKTTLKAEIDQDGIVRGKSVEAQGARP